MSASVPLEIPGFYYDAEKRKYFKVEAHGPISNPYSHGNVTKRLKAEAERKKLSAQIKQKVLAQQRRKHLRNTYLNRELGFNIQSHSLLREQYIRRCQNLAIAPVPSTHSSNLTSFTIDPSTQDLFLGTEGGLVSSLTPPSADICANATPQQNTITRFTAAVTTVNISKTRLLTCASRGNEYISGSVHLGRLISDLDDPNSIGMRMHTVLTPIRRQALYCSAANPYVTGAGSPASAVGGESMIIIVRENESGIEQDYGSGVVDCLGLEFLDREIMGAGFRDGNVTICDFREGLDFKGVQKMRHRSSVCSIRQVDDFLLVVAGLKNSLAMYDLRFVTDARWADKSTVPVIEYKEHHNGYTLGLGFDVSLDGSILAACGSDHKVRLWSIHSGERINTRFDREEFEGDIVGCKFRDNGALWIGAKSLEFWDV